MAVHFTFPLGWLWRPSSNSSTPEIRVRPGSMKWPYFTFLASRSTIRGSENSSVAPKEPGRLDQHLQHQHASHDRKGGEVVGQVFLAEGQVLGRLQAPPLTARISASTPRGERARISSADSA